jgi:hypothetical protein
MERFLTLLSAVALCLTATESFMGAGPRISPPGSVFGIPQATASACRTILAMSGAAPELKRVSPDQEGIPIPFVDKTGNDFIECYADTIANINGVEYVS